jgi:aminomethyltransferase
MLKRTPLYAAHQKLGARLVEFGGWEMPVQYSSIVEEHLAVRNAAGLFDISHMGEIFVQGPASTDFLNEILTNDAGKLSPGQGQYTLMCTEAGGVIDDLYLYCLGLGTYLLIVNASRIDTDYAWIDKQHQKFARANRVFISNKSDSHGAIAVQGPETPKFIDAAVNSKPGSELPIPSRMKKNEIATLPCEGEFIYVARTGYTGETGFEIVAPAHLIEKLWWDCLKEGEKFGIKPAGLGARDTLRTEMGYPLYGHELDERITPVEAGLSYFVSFNKGHFIGRSRLLEQKESGVGKKLVGFKMSGKTPPPRPEYPIWWKSEPGNAVGIVTSGTQSPSLNLGIGLGYVPAEIAKQGVELEIEIRGRKFPAVVAPKPFYTKPNQ